MVVLERGTDQCSRDGRQPIRSTVLGVLRESLKVLLRSRRCSLPDRAFEILSRIPLDVSNIYATRFQPLSRFVHIGGIQQGSEFPRGLPRRTKDKGGFIRRKSQRNAVLAIVEFDWHLTKAELLGIPGHGASDVSNSDVVGAAGHQQWHSDPPQGVFCFYGCHCLQDRFTRRA